MLKWDARDWTCAIIGWICAIVALWLVPESMGFFKLALVFLAGFCSAWIMRSVIPH